MLGIKVKGKDKLSLSFSLLKDRGIPTLPVCALAPDLLRRTRKLAISKTQDVDKEKTEDQFVLVHKNKHSPGTSTVLVSARRDER